MVFAYIVSMCRDSFRGSGRVKAFKLLRNCISRAIVLGFTFTVLHFSLDESYDLVTPTVQANGNFNMWNDDYLDYAKPVWVIDLMSDNKPWITSTSTSPTLSDYVAFGLDPATARSSRKVRAIKRQMLMSALSIVSQLAQFIESRITSFTESFDTVKTKRIGLTCSKPRKLTPAETNVIVSSVVRMITAGEESNLHDVCV